MSTRLFSVALCRILAVSVISTMKVDKPLARSSEEPIRVKIRSTSDKPTLSAGTKAPQCAKTTMSAFCRMYVDLPPMLGPVISNMRLCSLSRVLLAINGLSLTCSTTGCRPFEISSCASALNEGRLRDRASARSAKQASTSRSQMARDVVCSGTRSSAIRSTSASYRNLSLARARLRLDKALSSNCFSSGVMNRSTFLSVCRRW